MNEGVLKILENLNKVVNSSELAAIVKENNADGEFELSKEGLEAIVKQTNGLMSMEAAVRNKDVSKALYPTHAKTAMGKVEAPLKGIMASLNIDYSTSDFISDKVDEIPEKIKAIKEATGTDDKKYLETLKTERDLRIQLQTDFDSFKESSEIKLTEQQGSFTKQRIKDKVLLKGNEKTWASAFDEKARVGTINSVYSEIAAKAHIHLSDSGEIELRQKENHEMEYMEGNKVVSFQSLLDNGIDPYLKKSDPNPSPNPNPILPTGKEVEMTPQQISIRDNAKTWV